MILKAAHTLIWRLASLAVLAGSTAAQDMEVPVDVQFAIFSKILAFDRNLKDRSGEEVVIGVLYQQSQSGTNQLLSQVRKLSKSLVEMEGIPVHFVYINGDDIGNLAQALSVNEVDILYVCPIQTPDLSVVSVTARSRKVVTLTGVPAYVHDGLSIGVMLKDRKPKPMINLAQAKSEGLDLASRVLSLSITVKDE